MGKKGKKGKGGKKKKKPKKPSEPQMTWKEALLAYQINITERQLEDVQYELRALDEKRARERERNKQLKEEQQVHLELLLKQANTYEKHLSQKTDVEELDVVNMLKEKWEVEKKEAEGLSEMKLKISHMEEEFVLNTKDVTHWKEYRDRGKEERAKQIKLLEQELIDMEISHAEMSEHLTRALEQSKDEIDEKVENTMSSQKHLASDKAIEKLDKTSRQEVLSHDWLIHEVEIHRREAKQLMDAVEELERANLEVMSELFDCTVEDLKISRNFFLTQFEDAENLEETGILEMDLSQLAIKDLSKDVPAKPLSPVARPVSATQQYVEDKVFCLTSAVEEEEKEEDRVSDREDEDAQFDEVHYNDKDNDEDNDPFNNYFHFDDEDFEEYLQLGPLELKLLSVSGKKVPIHPLEELADKHLQGARLHTEFN